MPRGIVFCKVDALALDRVADNNRWLVVNQRNAFKRNMQRLDIMSVALRNGKAESAPLLSQRHCHVNSVASARPVL